MGEDPPPLPVPRREPLLRGPLILTAIGRVLMIPFFLFCAVASSVELKIFYHRLDYYHAWFLAGKVGMALSTWNFALLHMLLAWLFFARRRIFRPLMVYVSLLPFVYLAGAVFYLSHFHQHRQPRGSSDPNAAWEGFGVLVVMAFWPLYYGFSPRVKRVFNR